MTRIFILSYPHTCHDDQHVCHSIVCGKRDGYRSAQCGGMNCDTESAHYLYLCVEATRLLNDRATLPKCPNSTNPDCFVNSYGMQCNVTFWTQCTNCARKIAVNELLQLNVVEILKKLNEIKITREDFDDLEFSEYTKFVDNTINYIKNSIPSNDVIHFTSSEMNKLSIEQFKKLNFINITTQQLDGLDNTHITAIDETKLQINICNYLKTLKQKAGQSSNTNRCPIYWGTPFVGGYSSCSIGTRSSGGECRIGGYPR
jgi:hypothetical protein